LRKLLNTLYVINPNTYLTLDGENIVVKQEDKLKTRVPLHNLESIITFGYSGVSPALMGACAKRDIALTFVTMNGRFLASVVGEQTGSVYLRKKQFIVSEDERKSAQIAKNMLIGKFYNSRFVIERTCRDYPLRVDVPKLKKRSQLIKESLTLLSDDTIFELDSLRGIEGRVASEYFEVFDDLILSNKADFYFHGRTRRPPLDNVNAMLSFMYTILSNDVASALSSVGLDPFVGFLHRDRPGRRSLALDLMEELRAPMVDRFVLTLINSKQISSSDFIKQDNGAVIMNDETRKKLLAAWQKKKQEQLTHPFLKEKITWGLVPYVQSLLLARFLRGDLDDYPPFLWK
jgi:CRISPR-associated protein Cas1